MKRRKSENLEMVHLPLNGPSPGKVTDPCSHFINMCVCAAVGSVLFIQCAWGAPDPKGKVDAIAGCGHCCSPARRHSLLLKTLTPRWAGLRLLVPILNIVLALFTPDEQTMSEFCLLALGRKFQISFARCFSRKWVSVHLVCYLQRTAGQWPLVSSASAYGVMIASMTLGILHNTRYLVKIFPTMSEDALLLSFIKRLLDDSDNVPLHSRLLGLVSLSTIALLP